MRTKSGRVLVTGANGFVGSALCKVLQDSAISVKSAVRNESAVKLHDADYITVGVINGSTDWASALAGIDCVVHLAARVHVMNETTPNPLEEFRLVNTLGTEKLARDAVAAGVKRLVYLSTVKVNGEETTDTPFTEHVAQAPADPYGLSKWEAEQSLRKISAETGLEVVIIRPPLVYGVGVKGNFQALLKAVSRGVPFPLGSVENRRSLVSLGNLVSLIRECIVNSKAAGETFLVSDGQDLSTAELIAVIANAMGKSARLMPVPVAWLNFAASILGKKDVASRLWGSLQVDSTKAGEILGWNPPNSIESEIGQVVNWYRSQCQK